MRSLFMVYFLLTFQGVSAQYLSGRATISVLTLGPSQDELYSAFGHSAIRVADPVNEWDVIYNYGVFDFDQPNFYLNFTRGKLYYQLGVHSYGRFKDTYIQANRKIVEQVLLLDSAERQKLFDYLQWNARPENKNYFYNYIYDNCATKIRDVLDIVFERSIQYDYSYVTNDLTFRDLMDLYLSEQPWGDLGIDICLGTGIDIVASGYHYMYLPDYIALGFAGATRTKDARKQPLIASSKVIYEPAMMPPQGSAVTPQMTFIGIFLFFGFLSFKDLKAGKRSNWIDVLLFSTAGIVGWLLLFLWFFTDHIAANNFNLMWAFPLHFPLTLFLVKKEKPTFLKKYFLVIALTLGTLIVFWGFWPQNLHDSLIPFALILLIRAILIWREPKL